MLSPEPLIHSQSDLALFQSSPTHSKILDFVGRLGEAVQGSVTATDAPTNPFVERLCSVLFPTLDELIASTPPIQQPMRYGNTAYRVWRDKVDQAVTGLVHAVAPDASADDVTELTAYLQEAFGNRVRIDYGSGHELNFLCFLIVATEAGLCDIEKDGKELVLHAFTRYLSTARKVQRAYGLEPAGSRGVWGLDDYQFLPFLWGAYQLRECEDVITPEQALQSAFLDKYSSKYLYLDMLRSIVEVKTGAPFSETSPLLNDISAARSWRKISIGFTKMYAVEVLGKFPVMQHFMFGKTLAFPARGAL